MHLYKILENAKQYSIGGALGETDCKGEEETF